MGQGSLGTFSVTFLCLKWAFIAVFHQGWLNSFLLVTHRGLLLYSRGVQGLMTVKGWSKCWSFWEKQPQPLMAFADIWDGTLPRPMPTHPFYILHRRRGIKSSAINQSHSSQNAVQLYPDFVLDWKAILLRFFGSPRVVRAESWDNLVTISFLL